MLDLIKFDISARDRAGAKIDGLKSKLGGVRGALAGVNDQAKRVGRSMRNIGAGMTAGVSAPVALLGKSAIRAYDTQLKAEKSVEQAILSTGGAAGKSADDLKSMASALQGITTFGDEDILSNVTAPMLTFTKVQGDVFDRAQANVLDMATLLKMDLKSASVLVGKALNDPVKGISALSRSGVTFSDSQKDVIKSLVETGDVAGAQAVILKELETQFKGQAAAAANTPLGKYDQLSNAIGDLKEELGEQVVPFLVPLVEKVKAAVAWFGQLSPEVKRNIVVVGGLAAVVGPVVTVLGLATMGLGSLASAFGALSAVILANPIVAAIATIAGGAYLIYNNWSSVKGFFEDLFQSIHRSAQINWNLITDVLEQHSPEWLKRSWAVVAEGLQIQWDLIRQGIDLAWGGISSLFRGEYSPEVMIYPAWSGVGAFFEGLGPRLLAAFQGMWASISAELATWPARMVEIGGQIVQGLIDGVKQRASGAVEVVRGMAGDIMQSARNVLGIQSPSRQFMQIGKHIVEGLGLGIRENADIALSEVNALGAAIKERGQQTTGFLSSLRSGAQQAFTSILTSATSLRQGLGQMFGSFGSNLLNSGINSLFGLIFPNAKGNAFANGRVTPFANGGVVNGPTLFPMAGASTGLMGEAGPEAIMPLTRVGGKLGVRAQGGSGQSVVFNYAPNIDARGADQAAVDRLEAGQRAIVEGFEAQVHSILRRGRNRRHNDVWSAA